jgi:hypothetical protein
MAPVPDQGAGARARRRGWCDGSTWVFVETCWTEGAWVARFNKEPSGSTDFHTPDPQADSSSLLKLVAEGRSQRVAVEPLSAAVRSDCR